MRKIIFVSFLGLVVVCLAMKPQASVGSVQNSDSTQIRTVILLRHAKSDKSNMNMPDIQRPLEASGMEEAKEMGRYIAEQKLNIDVIISSPALRTKQTLEIICPLIGYPFEKVIWDSTLYACSGEHLVTKVKLTDSRYTTVMYVGHNPSMTDAANALQSDTTISEVKTCGVVAIEFIDAWKWMDVKKETGTLRFYRKPK